MSVLNQIRAEALELACTPEYQEKLVHSLLNSSASDAQTIAGGGLVTLLRDLRRAVYNHVWVKQKLRECNNSLFYAGQETVLRAELDRIIMMLAGCYSKLDVHQMVRGIGGTCPNVPSACCVDFYNSDWDLWLYNLFVNCGGLRAKYSTVASGAPATEVYFVQQ